MVLSLLLRLETFWAGLLDPLPTRCGAVSLMQAGESKAVHAAPQQDPLPVRTGREPPRGVLGTPPLHPPLHKLWPLESTVLNFGRTPGSNSSGK